MKKAFVPVVVFVFSFSVAWSQSGSLDLSFNGTGKTLNNMFYDYGDGPQTFGQENIRALAVQPDGKIIGVGKTYDGLHYDFGVIRLKTDGTRDSSFGIDGTVYINFGNEDGYDDDASAVAIQPDGKIVVVGVSGDGPSPTTDMAIARLNADGSKDYSFGGVNGFVFVGFGGESSFAKCVTIQPDGKILVAGSTSVGPNYDFALARLNTDGTLDNSFNGGGKQVTSVSPNADEIYGMALQPDGKIVVTGYTFMNFIPDVVIMRYNSNGSLDYSFDGDAQVITSITSVGSRAQAVALQTDGKIVIAGYAHTGVANHFFVARFNTDGSPDSSFDGDGKTITALSSQQDYAYAVAIQPDGKILAGGQRVNSSSPYDDFALVRYLPNGSLDNSFDGDGKVFIDMGGVGSESIYSLAIFNNRIYAGGPCNSFSVGMYVFAIAAVQMDGSGTPLPVGLTDFTGRVVNSMVQLQWKTLSEYNTSQFIIERSGDGANFVSIGAVQASGNTSSIKNYSFTDQRPLQGTSFYRLKMMDIDGHFIYSKVVAVSLNESAKKIRLFPNPAHNELYVQINGFNEAATLLIIDITGRTIEQEQLTLSGNNSFSIDTKKIPKGKYTLVLQLREGKETKAFMKN